MVKYIIILSCKQIDQTIQFKFEHDKIRQTNNFYEISRVDI